MKKSTYILLFVICFYSCNNYPKTPPTDFNFFFRFGIFDDHINTIDSTYTQDNKTIKIAFTKGELQRIYKTLADNDYLSLPDNFPEKAMGVPHDSYILEVFANGKKKYVCLDDRFDEFTTDNKSLKFMHISDTITRILYSKKEYQQLPKTLRLAE
jgi:hypothetical protein